MAGRGAYVWPVAAVRLAPRLAVERVKSNVGRSVRVDDQVWNDKGFSEHYTEMGALETELAPTPPDRLAQRRCELLRACSSA